MASTQVPLPEEFPVPVDRFARTLVGTEDEIWVKLLRNTFQGEKKVPDDWRAALSSLKRM